MAFSENVTAITNDVIVRKVVDQVLTGSILTTRLIAKAKKWKGESLTIPVQIARQSNGTSYSNGMKTFNTNISDTKRKLSFSPVGKQMPVVIDGLARDVNATDDRRAVDLVKEAMEEAGNSLLEDIADNFYSTEAGLTADDFDSLNRIVDDGGEAGTYGGLSRTTYTSLQSNEYDIVGALTDLDPIRTGVSAAKRGSMNVTLHVTSETKWDEFEGILQPSVQYNAETRGYKQATREGIVESASALQGNVGFDVLMFRGKPVVADERCPDLQWFGLNEDTICWYGLKSTKYDPISLGDNNQIDGPYSKTSKYTGFSFSGLMDPINQYSEVGHIILQGNLVSKAPNTHFVLNFSA